LKKAKSHHNQAQLNWIDWVLNSISKIDVGYLNENCLNLRILVLRVSSFFEKSRRDVLFVD
jgi:hypothetical protein